MRKNYIDNIRWMTVALVAFYHVFFCFNASGVVGGYKAFSDLQYQDAVCYIIYPWFMLLLFVVSGISTRYYLAGHTDREFIRSRTTKLLVPSTIGVLVFWWILGYFNTRASGVLDTLKDVPKPIAYFILSASGIGALWFIQLLWVLSVILILIRKIIPQKLQKKMQEKEKKINVPILIMLFFVIWGASQVLNTPVVEVYRFGIYGAGFFIGYLFFYQDEVMEKLEKWWLPLGIVAVILAAACLLVFWGRPYADSQILKTPLCNAFAWLAVLAILAFMKKWGNFENSFSRWMTKKSWGLYLFHYLPLIACALVIYPCRMPVFLKYILTMIAAFAGGFLLYEVISRIPFLRWCVCGIRKKK